MGAAVMWQAFNEVVGRRFATVEARRERWRAANAGRWWRGLRSRLTLLVTLAVMLAIAFSAGACWLLVRSELYDQIDRTFEPPTTALDQRRQFADLEKACEPQPQPFRQYGQMRITQIIYADGRACYVGPAIQVAMSDRRIAANGGREKRNGVTVDGLPIRIMTDG